MHEKVILHQCINLGKPFFDGFVLLNAWFALPFYSIPVKLRALPVGLLCIISPQPDRYLLDSLCRQDSRVHMLDKVACMHTAFFQKGATDQLIPLLGHPLSQMVLLQEDYLCCWHDVLLFSIQHICSSITAIKTRGVFRFTSTNLLNHFWQHRKIIARCYS